MDAIAEGVQEGLESYGRMVSPPPRPTTAIITLTEATSEMIDVLDDDLMIRRLEADLVVESNAKSLALTHPGAARYDLCPPNQKLSGDMIRGVTTLYIVCHGSGTRLAGLLPNVLARNLYAGLYEEIKRMNPERSQDDHFRLLSYKLDLREVYLVACHGARGGTSANNFAKQLFGYISKLPMEWKRPLKVEGMDGSAIVDYEGKIRVIPSGEYNAYKNRKKLIKGGNKRQQHMELLDEYAPVGSGRIKYSYDPTTLNF